MGKKATILLTDILFSFITILLALAAVIGWFTNVLSPEKSGLVTIIALGMTPILILNFVCFIIWAVRRKMIFITSLVAILINMGYITSIVRFDFRSDYEIAKNDIKIATYNIHGKSHEDFSYILNTLFKDFHNQQIDIICFQEFYQKDGQNFVSEFYPYRVVESEHKGMQLAVFSKYPITYHKYILFKECSNGVLFTELNVNGKSLNVTNAHLRSTNMNQSQTEFKKVKSLGIDDRDGNEAFNIVLRRLCDNTIKRGEQAEMVRRDMAARSDKYNIICGDFNDTPSSYVYRYMKEGLEDSFKVAGNGYIYTFKDIFKLFRLDYILYSKEFKANTHESPNLDWSDHNPVIVGLSFQ